jgi:hypothetical protein
MLQKRHTEGAQLSHRIAKLLTLSYTYICGTRRYFFARLAITTCSQEANNLPI